jgi:hypothetical protein
MLENSDLRVTHLLSRNQFVQYMSYEMLRGNDASIFYRWNF